MAENAGRSRSSLQGVRRPVVAQVDSANATNNPAAQEAAATGEIRCVPLGFIGLLSGDLCAELGC